MNSAMSLCLVGMYVASMVGPPQQALERLSLAPALFVENQGQWSDPGVRYVHDGSFADIAITDSGVVFHVARKAPKGDTPVGMTPGPQRERRQATDDVDGLVRCFSASLVGSKAVRPAGGKCSPSVFHYHVGDRANWRQGVRSYETVAYQGLYDGIDLEVWGLRSHLKYEFHVAPGADYHQIRVRYEGIRGLSIAADGSLEVDLGGQWGVIRDDAPYIYQEIEGRKVEVAGRFVLLDDHTYSFDIGGTIDPGHALTIDPDLCWSTYLGGTAFDRVGGICVDAAGNVYVTGETNSAGWVSDGHDTVLSDTDAYVVKLTATGGHVWSTYLGGANSESWLGGIAADPVGGIYTTGLTNSPNWVSGGFDTVYAGSFEGFVAKLSADGTHDWSTYLRGGSPYNIAADPVGAVYLTGSTSVIGWTTGGFDTSYNGGESDTFVMKLTSDGAHAWSTYLGGAADDGWAGDIAVSPTGGLYVTGATGSAGWTSGGFDEIYNGGLFDTFVAKLTANGGHVWSTYLGGTETEVSYGIAVDDVGDAYITGITNSPGWVGGGFDTTMNSTDAFVVKLTGAGAHSWSTYVGGSGADQGKGISVDAAGRVYVAGQTDSGGWTSGGFDTIHDGGWDVFIACLTDAGAHVWSSHLGGPADEDADEIVAVQGSVYVAGDTRSGNWVAGGFDTSYGGSSDGFVAKITEGEACRVMHDWNGDGIVSIVGDVPPFVDCVYLGDCSDWPEGWLLPIGDCSQDGILSIIGDVPCFVDCVYFGNCSQ